ncbi:MAG TPA: carboxyl transferase domain-containing protein, partial [Bacillota bacterium]|nr:carboxyl transferase domain-containing protein [Bacillota bacterium]
TVDGRLVFGAFQDETVYGGSMGRAHAEKIVKAILLAIDAGAPFVYSLASGGARIEEGVEALEGMGHLIASLCEAKYVIPLLCIINGHCPGGLSLAAAKADFVVMTDASGLYINSPVVTANHEGKSIKPSDIGTAKSHQTKTGLASFVAENDDEACSVVRTILSYIPVETGDEMTFIRAAEAMDDMNRESEALNQMAEKSDEQPVDVFAVAKEIVDSGDLYPIASSFGDDSLTALARLDGMTVGMIGNLSTRMSLEGAKKLTKFVRFCDAFMIPIISLTNAEGFAIGLDVEDSSVIEAASALTDALYEADVPRIGLLVGKAIGTSYLTMNSKMLSADVVYAWPTAEVAVMSSDTAAMVLFTEKINASDNPTEMRAKMIADYKSEISDPTVSAHLGQIDEIILPSASRPRIISALDMLLASYPLEEN